jgi:hypothetical protein
VRASERTAGDLDMHEPSVLRSQFVTAVAWVFIVLSGLGVLIALAQNAMMLVMFNTPEMETAMAHAHSDPSAPPFSGALLGGMRYVFVFVLLLAGGMLAASIGLLRRNNTARVAFITLLVLGIAWNVFGLVVQGLFVSHLPIQDLSSEGGPDMRTMFKVMFGFGVVFVLVISGVFAWIIKRLTSPAIRAEFH